MDGVGPERDKKKKEERTPPEQVGAPEIFGLEPK